MPRVFSFGVTFLVTHPPRNNHRRGRTHPHRLHAGATAEVGRRTRTGSRRSGERPPRSTHEDCAFARRILLAKGIALDWERTSVAPVPGSPKLNNPDDLRVNPQPLDDHPGLPGTTTRATQRGLLYVRTWLSTPTRLPPGMPPRFRGASSPYTYLLLA